MSTRPVRPSPKRKPPPKRGRVPAWYLRKDEFAWIDKAGGGDKDPARGFAQGLLDAPRAHCRWVHLAVRRHCMDLRLAAEQPERFPYCYLPPLAARPIAFAAQFRLYGGEQLSRPLTLLPWQKFIVSQVYGWRRRDNPHKRRYAYAYISVPRKNGKTGLLAPLGLYHLCFTPKGSVAQVYSVATKEEQAKLVWKDAIRLLKTAPRWDALFRVRNRHIVHAPSGSEWAPLGADSRSQDGLRPDLAILDELHAWRDRALWDVIDSAFGASYSPLLFQITTSGVILDGICREQEARVMDVLKRVEKGTYRGEVGDTARYFGVIWTVDRGDKWEDPAAWAKANPSLGTIKSLESMQGLALTAKKSSGARREFLIKHLNQWQTGSGTKAWLDPHKWAACAPGAALSQAGCWERLRGLKVWCGLDLASVGDTSSFCAIAEDPQDPRRLLVAWHFWLPSEQIADRSERDAQPYDLWAAEGYLNLTAGAVTDVTQVERDIVESCTRYALRVDKFAYDPGHEQGVAQRLQDAHGLPMFMCAQRWSTLTGPTNELERLVEAGWLDHGGQLMAAAQAACVVLAEGPFGGRTPAKGRSRGRIDGIAALVDALAARAASLEQAAKPPPTFAVYFD